MVSTNGVHEPLMGKSVVWGAQSSLETKLSGLDVDLPLEAVVLILERLSLRDLLALKFSCNAFDAWSRYATRIQASFHVPYHKGVPLRALSYFIQRAQCVRRIGLQIEAARSVSGADLGTYLQELSDVLQQCSPTLHVLRLRLFQTTDFLDYNTDALHLAQLSNILGGICSCKRLLMLYSNIGLVPGLSSSTPSMGSICSCKHLRTLYINTGLVPGLCSSAGDAISMFCEQLPNLLTLQWRMATSGPERPNHFNTQFVTDVATTQAKGLQLLQVDNFTFEDKIILPLSLRYAAICNEAFELQRPIGDLLHSCRNLEELYLTGYQCTEAQDPDMSTIWPKSQHLRILVLDVLQDSNALAKHASTPGLQTLPKLRILIVRHLCTVGHLLHVRCPDLHTMVLFVGSLSHTIFLEIFLRQQHDSLASLQVLFYNGARQQELYRQFWSSLCPVQALQKVQLVMSATHAEPVQETHRLLEAAYCPKLMCLSGLSEIAIYIDSIFEESVPVHFFTGGELSEDEESNSAAELVLAVGKLVSAGIFPELKKVFLYPCWDVSANGPASGMLPSPESAPDLQCHALPSPGDRTGGEWGQGLRSMVGSSDEQAALRAIESLSVSYDVDELL